MDDPRWGPPEVCSIRPATTALRNCRLTVVKLGMDTARCSLISPTSARRWHARA